MPDFHNDAPARMTETVTVREILEVIDNHKRLVLATVVLFVAAAAALSFLEDRVFRATAVIRLSDVRPILPGERESSDVGLSRATDPLLSRLEVLRSRTLIGSVVDSLGLRLIAIGGVPRTTEIGGWRIADDAASDTLRITFGPEAFRVSGKASTTGASYGDTARLAAIEISVSERPEFDAIDVAILPRELAIDRALDKLQVARREGTDVVDVSYVSASPYVAQAVANAVVVKFQEQRVADAREQSRIRREFLEEQLTQTEAILKSSESELAAYRSRQNLAGTAERISAEQTELLSLETRLQELLADRQLVADLAGDLESGDDATRSAAVRAATALPQLASQPAVVGLYGQIMQYQGTLDSLTTGPFRVAPTNPDVVQLQNLIRSTEGRIVEALTSYVAAIDARIAALESIRDRAAASVQALPGKEAEQTRLGRQVAVTAEMANELRLEYQEAKIAENVQIGDVVIVDMAPLPYSPANRLWWIKIALGLLLGLGTGTVLAFLREAKDTSFRRPEEVDDVLKLPSLAIIPPTPELVVHGEGKLTGLLPRLVSQADQVTEDTVPALQKLGTSDSLSREAFRVLRTSVLSSIDGGEGRPRSIVVTSVGPGEGKTVTAVNLAISFAHKGMSIVLLDCDVRRPRVHSLLELPRAPGLADLLDPRSSYFLRFRQVVRRTPLENLSVISCGTRPLDPLELFEGAPIRRLLADLSGEFDVVVLDSPPVLAAADTLILGQLVDGAILVIRAGQTEREAAQRAYAQLSLAKVRVLGAIFNDPDGRQGRYAGSYQRYGDVYATDVMDG